MNTATFCAPLPAARHMRIVSAANSALCITMLTLLVYFLILEKPFLTYENLPFPAPTVAHPGEVVPLQVKRCNSSDEVQNYNTTHGVQLIDTAGKSKGIYYMLPDVRVSIPPGCTVSTSLLNALPAAIPPGHYRLFGTAEVPGTIRNHMVDWHSQPFTVVPKPQVRINIIGVDRVIQ